MNLGIVIECKQYTWTEVGNVHSAKIGFTNEAAFYLRFLPDIYGGDEYTFKSIDEYDGLYKELIPQLLRMLYEAMEEKG